MTDAADPRHTTFARTAALLQRLADWAQRRRLERALALGLAVAAGLSGLATYWALTEAGAQGPDPGRVVVLLYVNLGLLLLLGLVVARRIVEVWAERRRGLAGSRLHVRLVVLFSLVAVTPAILVAIFSALFLHIGVRAWFDERVRTALDESLAVAEAYLGEHQQNIRADALAMVADINRDPYVESTPGRLGQILAAQTAIRGLTEAMVLDGVGRVSARSALTFSLEFDTIPEDALARARAGEVVVLTSDSDDRVRALVKIERLVDTFLYVGRFVEQQVVVHMNRTREAVDEYRRLQGSLSQVQIMLAGIFGLVALLLLLASIWVGLVLATQLWEPISALIAAAERVRAGDLGVRVDEGAPADELGTLSRAFNRMTGQLAEQRRELVEASRQIDERRRFTEAVLDGVSAGVVGLDAEGRVHLPNRVAAVLLGLDLDQALGQRFATLVPEAAGLLAAAMADAGRVHQAQIVLEREPAPRTLLVRIAGEPGEGGAAGGFVVTFDDITELLSAQRKAAWADVARRIAHEIKNPLTPIQLSAERLKRKYLREVVSDPETFAACTDTIVRHVGDIGRMVDEFSAFARLPAPILRQETLQELVREAVLLQANANPAIAFDSMLPEAPVTVTCDARQVVQSLTNILKNAVEAIEARHAAQGESAAPGRIEVTLAIEDDRAVIEVADNGRGLPREGRDRLTEPYVTTRDKGTGLGLAIVRKVMEDHGGFLALADREGGGARVRLIFPLGGAMPAPSHRSRRRPAAELTRPKAAHGA